MSAVKRVMLLLLLAAIGTNAVPDTEGCESLNKTLPTKDLHKIYGDWVLVWSVSQDAQGMGLLANLTSSHVELHLRPDNKTILYHERNLFHDNSCTEYLINLTIPSDHSEHPHLDISTGRLEQHGVVELLNISGEVHLYETECSDCLAMVYRGGLGHYLLAYKREGQHQDAELLKAAHGDHKKLAECLGFPHDKPFSYDGAADLCPHKSSPAVDPEQH